MKIFAIESSCDETSCAVLEVKRGRFELLSNTIHSQVKVHAKYGGVVPEVAARLHIQKVLPVVEVALKEAKTKLKDIDYFAVTAGPGLMSSLLVGVETAKTLAYAYNKPIVRVNHIEGHILASEKEKAKSLKFPAIALVVSGGHTQIILVKDYLKYKLIGETRDDASGEAFDKVAKILDIGYPGGPAISKLAKKYKKESSKFEIKLPRPMINSDNFEMSFSGLKTAVLYEWQKAIEKYGNKTDLKVAFAKEFQDAVIEVLVTKTMRAVEKYKVKTLILGGGVSANQELRKTFESVIKERDVDVDFYYPELSLTGDNAAMIAMAAYYHIEKKDFVDPFKLKADPNWELV